MKGTRRQRHLLGLVDQRFDDFGMAVSLIDCAVCREEIKVFVAVDIPHFGSLALCKDHGERMVVVRSVLVFEIDVGLGEGGDGRFGGRGGGEGAALEETAGGLEGGAEGHGLIILLVFRFRVDDEFANTYAKSMRGGVERCQKVSTYWWEVMLCGSQIPATSL